MQTRLLLKNYSIIHHPAHKYISIERLPQVRTCQIVYFERTLLLTYEVPCTSMVHILDDSSVSLEI